jgi:hypothetical protein
MVVKENKKKIAAYGGGITNEAQKDMRKREKLLS